MLQQLLENMQMMIGKGGEGQQGQSGQGQQSMQGLSDALREQQGLADDSFQQLQREFQHGRGRAASPATARGRARAGTAAAPSDRAGAGRPAGGAAPADGGARSAACPARPARRPARRCARPSATWARRATGCARATPRERSTGRPRRSTSCARACARWATTCAGPRAARDGEQGQVGSEATDETGRDPLGRPIGSRGSIGTNQDMLPEGDSAGAGAGAARRDPAAVGRAGAAADRARLPASAARSVLRRNFPVLTGVCAIWNASGIAS